MGIRCGLIYEEDRERPSCHAATVADLGGGRLMAAWFAGSRESAPDVGIVAMDHDGEAWGRRRVIVDSEGVSHYNPVLWPDRRTGRLWLFYCTGRSCAESAVMARISDDGGESFSDDIEFLPRHIGWLTRNKPLELAGGRWLLPLYDEKTWESMMAVSDDRGATWRMSRRITGTVGNIQPTLIQRDDGSILALLRCLWGHGRMLWSQSFDEGMTWSAEAENGLPNPGSGVDMVRLRNGDVVLIYNPLAEGRHRISAALSRDQGATWTAVRDLESDRDVPADRVAGVQPFDPKPAEEFEYSYPAVIETADGEVVAAYTYRRRSIKVCRFDHRWPARG